MTVPMRHPRTSWRQGCSTSSPPQNGAESEFQSVHVNFEQDTFDGKLRLIADALFSTTDSYQEFQTTITNVTVPATNAFNPYGRDLKVGYWPGNEIARLGLPPSYTNAETDAASVTFGGIWSFNERIKLHLSRTSSESNKEATQVRFDSPSFLGSNNPIKALFEELLASSDPAVALNFFGDGTVQSPRFEELATHALGPSVDKTELTKWEYKLEGEIEFLLPSPIFYAVGGEFAERTINSERATSMSKEARWASPTASPTGLASRSRRPNRTPGSSKWGLPIFEKREWAHKLLVNLQMRGRHLHPEGGCGI